MKTSDPRSRTRCTQPRRTTSWPTSPTRSAPHVCVRVSFPSGSICIICLDPLVLPPEGGSHEIEMREASSLTCLWLPPLGGRNIPAPDALGNGRSWNGFLGTRLQVSDRHIAARELVATQNRCKRNRFRSRVFHLFSQLVRLRVNLDANILGTQLSCKLQRFGNRLVVEYGDQ